MTIHPAVAPEDQLVSLLRPPSANLAQEIVAASNRLISQNTTYAGRGLLAFAAAMQARMFVEGETRKAAMNFAVGAELVAGPDDGMHTCVSAVLDAVQSALGVQTISIEEPPAPTSPPLTLAVGEGLALEGLCTA